jgi:hypothetical protein
MLTDTHQEKLATINEIYRSYLEKDLYPFEGYTMVHQ